MAHPLSDKVADRGPAGAVMDALWPILGGDQMDAETWTEISKAVGAALASGSDDHAELARLADLLDLYAAAREDEFTVEDVQLIDRGSGLISALLAEIAALRETADVSRADRKMLSDMAVQNAARATEAERKLAEARSMLLRWRRHAPTEALEDLTDAWLSKEAERG